MRKTLLMAGLVLLILPNAASAQQSDKDRCFSDPLDVEQIKACRNLLPLYEFPDDLAAVHFRRALGYQALGQLDDVIVDTSRALDLLRAFEKRRTDRIATIRNQSLLLRAKTYIAKGQDDLADADIEKLVAVSTPLGVERSEASHYNNRAWYYHLIGADAKGLLEVMKALEIDPKDARIIETRAEIYEKLGRRDEAIADYRAALAGDPAMKSAKDGLARMGGTP